MKNSVTKILFPLLFLSLVTNLLSFAQQSSDHLYMKVDYFRATGPQMADYLEVEQEIWKPMHQERFNRGIILSWDFYAVFAGDQADDYNYIAVNVFDDFDKIDYYDLSSIASEVYPDMDLGALMERTRASREVVRTEIWKVNKRLFKEGLTSPQGAYATARFYKNKKGNEGKDAGLTGFEEGVHLERISQDRLNSWGNYSVVYPDGVSTPYNRIEMNYYDQMIDLIQPVDLTVARQAFPDYDEALLKELLKQLDHSGALSKTEVWKRLDSIGNE